MNRVRWTGEIEATLKNIETDIDRLLDTISTLEKLESVAPKKWRGRARWIAQFSRMIESLQVALDSTVWVWERMKDEDGLKGGRR